MVERRGGAGVEGGGRASGQGRGGFIGGLRRCSWLEDRWRSRREVFAVSSTGFTKSLEICFQPIPSRLRSTTFSILPSLCKCSARKPVSVLPHDVTVLTF